MKDDPLFIYLDQNQWIYLSQAYHNRKGGEKYQVVLEKLRNAVENEKVILPLSAYHFLETQKDQKKERKERLAETMSNLSQGWGMALIDNITPVEIQIAGAKLCGYPLPNQPKIFERSFSLIWGIDLQALANKIAEENNEPDAASEAFLEFYREFLVTPQMIKLFLTGEIVGKSRLITALNGYKFGISNFAKLNKNVRSKVKLFAKSQLQQKRIFISDCVTGKETREILNNALAVYKKTIDDVISMEDNKVIEFMSPLQKREDKIRPNWTLLKMDRL